MLNRNERFQSRAAAVLCFLTMAASPLFAQNGPRQGPNGPANPPVIQAATELEAHELRFMREEEKLARDVYRALYEKWNLSVFDRIARSEEAHFTAVGRLLTRYGIDDPARNDVPGVFQNAELSALYAELMAKGMTSAKDALEVGLAIEKADIEDLEKALANTTKLDIKRVYSNLLSASLDHLEAFETNLEAACLNP